MMLDGPGRRVAVRGSGERFSNSQSGTGWRRIRRLEAAVIVVDPDARHPWGLFHEQCHTIRHNREGNGRCETATAVSLLFFGPLRGRSSGREDRYVILG